MTTETDPTAEALPAEGAAVPASEPAAAPEAPAVATEAGAPAAAALELHTDTPTLLEGGEEKAAEPVTEGDKPADPVKPEADKPAEEKPAEAEPEKKDGEEKAPDPVPEEPIVYEPFKVREGLTVDAEKMGAYTALLGENRIPQEVGQKLLDIHTNALQAYADNTLANQHKAFADTRAEWRKQVMADDQLGGAGFQTSMAAIARMRDMFVPEKDRKSFDEFLRITGAGDHPAFLRLLHNAARRFDEPAPLNTTVKPPPSNGAKPGKRGMSDLYDNTTFPGNR